MKLLPLTKKILIHFATGISHLSLLLIGLLLCTLPTRSQTHPDTAVTVSGARLQLVEYQQKILEARMELMEIKIEQKGMNKRIPSGIPAHIAGNVQETHLPDSVKPFTSAITFNISRIFEGTMQLGYEKALRNNLSLDLSIMGSYVTRGGFGKGYLNNQELAYADEVTNSYINYSGNMIRSIGGTVQLRNYLLARVNKNSKAPIGLYAAPQLMYRRVWITGNQYIYDYYFTTSKEITRNLDVMQGGVILGTKFPVAKVLCVDVYIGGVMRLSKYYNEKTFTKYKRWNNIDYSGILPTAGINIGILK